MKFSEHGVNGTICSFLVYLSEVSAFHLKAGKEGEV